MVRGQRDKKNLLGRIVLVVEVVRRDESVATANRNSTQAMIEHEVLRRSGRQPPQLAECLGGDGGGGGGGRGGDDGGIGCDDGVCVDGGG